MKNNNEKVRSSAAEALGAIGNETAVPALREALEDQSSNVRIQALDALEKLNVSWWGQMDSFSRWIAILLAVFLVGFPLLAAGNSYSQSEKFQKRLINILARMKNIKGLLRFVDDQVD